MAKEQTHHVFPQAVFGRLRDELREFYPDNNITLNRLSLPTDPQVARSRGVAAHSGWDGSEQIHHQYNRMNERLANQIIDDNERLNNIEMYNTSVSANEMLGLISYERFGLTNSAIDNNGVCRPEFFLNNRDAIQYGYTTAQIRDLYNQVNMTDVLSGQYPGFPVILEPCDPTEESLLADKQKSAAYEFLVDNKLAIGRGVVVLGGALAFASGIADLGAAAAGLLAFARAAGAFLGFWGVATASARDNPSHSGGTFADPKEIERNDKLEALHDKIESAADPDKLRDALTNQHPGVDTRGIAAMADRERRAAAEAAKRQVAAEYHGSEGGRQAQIEAETKQRIQAAIRGESIHEGSGSPDERGSGRNYTGNSSWGQDSPSEHRSPSSGSSSGFGRSYSGNSSWGQDSPSEHRSPSPGSSSGSGRSYSGNSSWGQDSPSEHRATSSSSHSSSQAQSGHSWHNSTGEKEPVVLDLAGTGLELTEFSQSDTFYDMAGDGQMHRTAWAGKGEGVLAIDANGDGKIAGQSEIVFTSWDASADSDLQAIKDVFDTNHNGKLDAGDTRFADFRVVVDGKVLTLAQAGVASIDLTAKGTGEAYADGSSINGVTSFTRTDGTTGAVGDATFASDDDGVTVAATTATASDGSKTLDQKIFEESGRESGEILTTTSADGRTVTRRFDDDGDGSFDRTKITVTTTAADRSITETVSDIAKDGRQTALVNRVTSADRRSVTVNRDDNGDGRIDRQDDMTTAADGSQTVWSTHFHADGSLDDRTLTTTSADGLTVTRRLDSAGHNAWDRTMVDATTVAADGTRTRVVAETANNGALLSTDRTVTAANALSRTETIDNDGDGLTDEVEADTMQVNADKSNVLTAAVTNRDGSLRSRTVTTTSGDGLTVTTQADAYGLGRFDLTTIDATAVAADGSRTETETSRHADGTLAGLTTVTHGATGRLVASSVDGNGDGKVEQTVTSSVAADGTISTVTSAWATNGALVSRTTDVASANGLVTSSLTDINGDGLIDLVSKSTTTVNADGSQSVSTWTEDRKGIVGNRKVVQISADGLTTTTSVDAGNDGTYEDVSKDVVSVAADGTRTETRTIAQRGRALLLSEVIVDSADRLSKTQTSDLNGDGKTDRITSSVTGRDGSQTDTETTFTASGIVTSRFSDLTSADGLTLTSKTDVNGDGVFDAVHTESTVLNADGGKTVTTGDTSSGNTLYRKTIRTVSGNGLTSVSDQDVNGDGLVDTHSVDAKSLNADGSTTEAVTVTNRDGSVRGMTVSQTSANGLTRITQVDDGGYGWFDRTEKDVTTLGLDGSKTERATVTNGDGTIRSAVVTTTNASGLVTNIVRDLDADGKTDQAEKLTVQSDGTKIDLVQNLNTAGAVVSQIFNWTSANGLARTQKTDLNGDGVYEFTDSHSLNYGADGASSEFTGHYSSNGTRLSAQSIWTAANGGGLAAIDKDHVADLKRSYLNIDADGDGVYETVEANLHTIGSDGTTTDLHYIRNANLTTRFTENTWTSADQLTTITRIDRDADGKIEEQTTTAMAASGIVTATTLEINTNKVITGRSITTTSADRLSVTTQTDENADGVFEETTVKTTTIATNGTRTDLIRTFAANGALLTRESRSVGGNGLSNYSATDLNGDGVLDVRRSEWTSFGANGSSHDISVLNGDGSLRSEVMTWTSGSGLARNILTDAAGLGWSQTLERDRTSISKAGVRTQSVTLSNADGTLRSSNVEKTSANGRTVTTTYDADGDGKIDRTDVVQHSNDGTAMETRKTLSAAGAVLWQQTVSTTADGQTTVTRTDADANGVYESVLTESTAIQADGTLVKTHTVTSDTGALIEKQVVATSGNGLTVKTSTDALGSGAYNLITTDSTKLGLDGSKIETIVVVNGNGSLHDATTKTLSADQKTTTIVRDLNGDKVVDWVETTTALADGSTQVTSVDYSGAGAVAHRKTVVTSADGNKVNTTWDADTSHTTARSEMGISTFGADGSTTTTETAYSAPGVVEGTTVTTTDTSGLVKETAYSGSTSAPIEVARETDTTSFSANGTQIRTVSEFDAAGTQLDAFVTMIAASGLGKETDWSFGSHTTVDQKLLTVTTLNKDGSSLTDNAATRASGSTISETQTWTSASGLVTETKLDLDGDGAYEVKRTDATIKNVDGSSVRTTTEVSATNVLRDRSVTTVDSTGRFTTVRRDAGGDGIVDQVEADRSNLDGSSLKTITDHNIRGMVRDVTSIQTSADGLTVATAWDLDGDGVVDRSRTDVTVRMLDGGNVETVIDSNRDGSLRQKAVVTTSDDGTLKVLQWDTDGNGSFDHVERTKTAVDGSSVTVTRDFNADGTIKNVSTTWLSGDGIHKHVAIDSDNNGIIDRDELTLSSVDGSKVMSFVDYDASHKALNVGQTITYADGLTSVTYVDKGKDGTIDHRERTVTEIDGTKITTALDYAADKTVTNTVVTTASANGQDAVIKTDNATTHTVVSTGTGNSIRVGDASYTISVVGNRNDVVAGKGADSIAVVGDENKITSSGSNTNISVTGNHDDVVASGANDNVIINGNYDNVKTTGTNDYVQLNGNFDTAVINGANSRADANGANDVITLNGVNDQAAATGTGDIVYAKGTGEYVLLSGANDIAIASGGNDTIDATGTNDAITLNGQNETAIISGSGDSVTVNGTNDYVFMDGSNESTWVYGNRDVVEVNGTADYVLLKGSGDTAIINGANDRVDAYGTGDYVQLNGTGDSAYIYGTRDQVDGNGSSQFIELRGNNDIAAIRGTGETVNSYGSGEQIVFYGRGNVLNYWNENVSINGLIGTNQLNDQVPHKSRACVICTHFNEKGLLSNELWLSDKDYAVRFLPKETLRGYHLWAIPFVRLMRKHSLLERVAWPLARAWAMEMAARVNGTGRRSVLGALMLAVGAPLCTVIGKFAPEQEWEALWQSGDTAG